MKPPIRAAFYYPWFPETWGSGTRYEPTLKRYDSSDLAVIQAHIYMMKYARIAAGIASWWGPGTLTDHRLTQLLDAANGTGFKWCPYTEAEGYANPSVAEIDEALDNLFPRASHPSWLRVNGKPVIFVYADPTDGESMRKRWLEANAGRFYVNLKVYAGYLGAGQPWPDSWHQYAPANAVQDQRPYCFAVSPGFWHANEEVARLIRDPDRFRSDVVSMVSSKADWQLITCFNEYGEGTAIEPTDDWGSRYLDILRRN